MSKFDFGLTVKMSLSGWFDQPKAFRQSIFVPVLLLYASALILVGYFLIFGDGEFDGIGLSGAELGDLYYLSQTVFFILLMLARILFSYSWQRFLLDGGDKGEQLVLTASNSRGAMWQIPVWKFAFWRYLLKNVQIFGMTVILPMVLLFFLMPAVMSGSFRLFWAATLFSIPHLFILAYVFRMQLVFPAILAGSSHATFTGAIKLSEGLALRFLAAYMVLWFAIAGVFTVAATVLGIFVGIAVGVVAIMSSAITGIFSLVLGIVAFLLYPVLVCASMSVTSSFSAFVFMQLHPEHQPVWQAFLARRAELRTAREKTFAATSLERQIGADAVPLPNGAEPSKAAEPATYVPQANSSLSPELAAELLPGPRDEQTGPRPKYGRRKKW